jgi:hypoxanthine phosphoribosyltransferase
VKPSIQRIAEVMGRAELLHSMEAVERAIERLAGEIRERLGRQDPLVLAVMNGALIPAGRLLPRLGFPLRVDYVHATRYRGTTRGRELHWVRPPPPSILDQHVLLVDDIFDEGTTLELVVEACRDAGARSVLSAVLVEKRRPRQTEYRPDFVGLQVADRYVFGSGMDYHEYLREVPGIYAVALEDL